MASGGNVGAQIYMRNVARGVLTQHETGARRRFKENQHEV